MSKDTNSFGHDKALACESRGFVYKKKRMHRFDTPSFIHVIYRRQKSDEIVQKNIMDFEPPMRVGE